MKVYTHWSFNPQKIRFALRELGVGAQEVTVDLLRGDQKTPAFTAINPTQKVPVLDDDGFVLWESNAILAYLGEREGRLWPTDHRSRADALRWMFFESKYLADSVGPLWFFQHAAPSRGIAVGNMLPDGTPLAERVAKSQRDLASPLGIANEHLASRTWILGESFSLADCSLGTTLAALAASDFDFASYPRVLEYAGRVCERDAWRATSPGF